MRSGGLGLDHVGQPLFRVVNEQDPGRCRTGIHTVMPSSERLDEDRFGREFPPGTVLQLDCQRAFDHIDIVDIGMLVLPNIVPGGISTTVAVTLRIFPGYSSFWPVIVVVVFSNGVTFTVGCCWVQVVVVPKRWTMNPASANSILIAASLNWNYMAKTARIPYRQNSAGRVAPKKTFMHKVSFKLNGGKRQPPLKLNCAMFNS
jgi:hypothetical protein